MTLDRATTALTTTATVANIPYAAINKWCVLAATVRSAGADSEQKLYGGDLQNAVKPVTTYATQTAGSGAVNGSSNNADTVIGGTGGTNSYAGHIAITAVWNKYLTLGQLRQAQRMLLAGLIPPDAQGVWYTGAHGPQKVYDQRATVHDTTGFQIPAHASVISGISMIRGFPLQKSLRRFVWRQPIDEAIWQLIALMTPTTDDLLVAVDDPSGTPATKKLALSNLISSLLLTNVVVQVKTVGSGTYTPTAGMKKVLGIAVGSGGGGGGGINTDSSGGGGGGGGTVIRLMTAAQIGASKAYVVGAGGAAAGNGNATTLDAAGALMNAGGGALGSAGATSTTVGTTTAGGAGGTATNGDLNIPGEPGERGTIFDGTNGYGGRGGNSMFGFGGAESIINTAGNAGTAYGGGGGGGHASATTDKAGAAGADGILFLLEFLD